MVDERALYEALAARRIAGAGLDVFEEEPTPASNPILKLDNVIVTPHALAWTDELFGNIARTAIGAILAVHAGHRPQFVVNPEVLSHPRVKGWLKSPPDKGGASVSFASGALVCRLLVSKYLPAEHGFAADVTIVVQAVVRWHTRPQRHCYEWLISAYSVEKLQIWRTANFR